CSHYTHLFNNADRKITYTSYHGYCDSGIGPGWFRFEGSAGIRMPTSYQPTNRCGTHITNWTLVSRTVCFHWTAGCCEFSTNIKVRRHCGSYYVYFLNGIPTCYSSYCRID
ncbi:unnamed protein product, partial [Porites lobata]